MPINKIITLLLCMLIGISTAQTAQCESNKNIHKQIYLITRICYLGVSTLCSSISCVLFNQASANLSQAASSDPITATVHITSAGISILYASLFSATAMLSGASAFDIL
jgi:hypothetical protein